MVLLRQWLAEQPFTLTMSSGFFSFFAHSGMLSALEENDLLPARVTGSSAGALVAGCWASGLDTQYLKQRLMTLDKDAFWDPGFGLGFLKGDRYRSTLGDMLPIENLEQGRVPISISVYSGSERRTLCLQKGDIVKAIYASGAVPFLFQPLRIDHHLCWDGGIQDRHGLAAVDLGTERVFYHHISSRSPWRRADSPALQVPEHNNMVSLAIDGLPRVGPNQLEVGAGAFQNAYEQTLLALEMPVDDDGSRTIRMRV